MICKFQMRGAFVGRELIKMSTIEYILMQDEDVSGYMWWKASNEITEAQG